MFHAVFNGKLIATMAIIFQWLHENRLCATQAEQNVSDSNDFDSSVRFI